MADATPKKVGAWTDDESYTLLYAIVQQAIGDNKFAVKFDKIEVPGRTTRAMSDRWAAMRKQMEAAKVTEGGADGGPVVAPVKTPKKAATKRKVKGEVGEDGEVVTPKKRKSPVKKQPVKEEVEPEAEAENEDDDMVEA